jgi:hypothetical protein
MAAGEIAGGQDADAGCGQPRHQPRRAPATRRRSHPALCPDRRPRERHRRHRLQELITDGCHGVTRYQPTGDKTMRLHAQTAMIENGFVHIPETAPWLAEILSNSSPRLIYWLGSLAVPAATAAPATPTTQPNAIRSTSRSIGRARGCWPDSNHQRPTNILARMEPGKATTPTNRGLIELSDGPLRTAAILYLPKKISCTPGSRPPGAYINRLFSANALNRCAIVS